MALFQTDAKYCSNTDSGGVAWRFHSIDWGDSDLQSLLHFQKRHQVPEEPFSLRCQRKSAACQCLWPAGADRNPLFETAAGPYQSCDASLPADISAASQPGFAHWG